MRKREQNSRRSAPLNFSTRRKNGTKYWKLEALNIQHIRELWPSCTQFDIVMLGGRFPKTENNINMSNFWPKNSTSNQLFTKWSLTGDWRLWEVCTQAFLKFCEHKHVSTCRSIAFYEILSYIFLQMWNNCRSVLDIPKAFDTLNYSI